MTFKEHYQEQLIYESFIYYWYNSVNSSDITEAKKVGLGVIDYTKIFSKGVGKIFKLLLLGKTDEAKKILTSIEKEDVLDFLFKLDTITFGLISMPVRIIDAMMGWDLFSEVKDKIKLSKDKINYIHKKFVDLKNEIISNISGDIGKKAVYQLNDIESNILGINLNILK